MKKQRTDRLTLPFMAGLAALLLALAVIFTVLYRLCSAPFSKALAITFFTVFYHLAMRLTVGETVTLLWIRHPVPKTARWFRQKRWETPLYRFLRVRRWKDRVLTARPEQFDFSVRTPEELLQSINRAEIVHEIGMVLSFLPLLMIPFFGAAPAFGITSVLGAAADAVFVVIQRYNRPRLVRLTEAQTRKQRR